MHTIFNLKIRTLSFIMLSCLVSIPSLGQNYSKAEWKRIKMDSAYDRSPGKATKVIDNYMPESEYLQKPVGICKEELKSRQLSDFATGALLDYATQRLARTTKNPQAKADLSILSFRNSKVCIKAGDVTPLDIISLFPMDNRIILMDLKGKYVRELMASAAKIGNTTVIGKNAELTANNIEDDRIYKVVLIDCLLKDKDCRAAIEKADSLYDCNTFLSNILIQHIQKLTKKGELFIKK